MSKDPAFLWYPNDYIGGTMGMTFEEKGAYIELLMMQFNRGHMEAHMIGQTVGQLWDKIKCKFIQDDNGLWYNVRLEYEQSKRKNYVSSRNKNLEGSNQYSKGKEVLAHMSDHMENENRNENKNKDKSVKSLLFPFSTLRFNDAWEQWKSYRKNKHNLIYESIDEEQDDLYAITNLSKGIESSIIKIIIDGIADDTTSFHKDKKVNNDYQDVEILINHSFNEFWDLYDKKVGVKSKLEKKWNKFTDDVRHLIMQYIPKYRIAQPDKQFRKNPEAFFNQEAWNDELIDNTNKNESHKEKTANAVSEALSDLQSSKD